MTDARRALGAPRPAARAARLRRGDRTRSLAEVTLRDGLRTSDGAPDAAATLHRLMRRLSLLAARRSRSSCSRPPAAAAVAAARSRRRTSRSSATSTSPATALDRRHDAGEVQLRPPEARLPEGRLGRVPGDPDADPPEPRPARRDRPEGAVRSASTVTDKQVDDAAEAAQEAVLRRQREALPGGAEAPVRHRRGGARTTSARTCSRTRSSRRSPPERR